MNQSSLTPPGIVVLVHGFNKKAHDMRYLQSTLSRSGWACVAVQLPTLFGDMDACVSALQQQLTSLVDDDHDQSLQGLTIHFVGHSMGGLIVREFIHRNWQQRTQTLSIASSKYASPRSLTPGHSVFIATPHHGSRLADYAVLIPGYKRAIKPINTLLPDAGYKQLPCMRNFRLGLIAGNQSHGILGNLLARPNDGHVEVSSVRTGDADDFIELPYHHKVIHHQPQTAALTHRFLTHGQWQLSEG